eukprot:1159067-Pelagomonas_calceolata.AAC.3
MTYPWYSIRLLPALCWAFQPRLDAQIQATLLAFYAYGSVNFSSPVCVAPAFPWPPPGHQTC